MANIEQESKQIRNVYGAKVSEENQGALQRPLGAGLTKSSTS